MEKQTFDSGLTLSGFFKSLMQTSPIAADWIRKEREIRTGESAISISTLTRKKWYKRKSKNRIAVLSRRANRV